VSRPIVITAGGTGGHVFPAEALASELDRRGFALALITDRRGGGYGETLSRIPNHRISAGQVASRGFVGRLLGLASLGRGVLQARRLMRRLRPVAAVGFGGYAAFPATLAATLSGIPTAIHEQNAVLGRANRLVSGRVRHIATAFAEVAGLRGAARARCVLTGNPVRDAVVALSNRPYVPPAEDGSLTLLILGGSQGARVFSDILPAALALLDAAARARLIVTQQCRPEDLEGVRDAYDRIGVTAELAAFFDDVPERLAAAHLVIARAGASTVAECTTAGRPAILVPYPWAVDDHQTANARAVAAGGAGWLMPQPEFTAAALAARLAAFLDAPTTLAEAAAKARAMGHPDAARKLAELVVGMMPDQNGGAGES